MFNRSTGHPLNRCCLPLVAVLAVFGAACSDARLATSPRDTPLGSVSPRAAREHLTQRLAIAMSEPTIRASVKRRLDASHAPEGKVQFQALTRAEGTLLLAALARAGATTVAGLLAELNEARGLELYLPVESHRGEWNGDDHLLVATVETDGEAPVAFDLTGTRRQLDPNVPPDVPVLALVPQESDFTNGHPERAMACWDICDDGNSGDAGEGGSGNGGLSGAASLATAPGLYLVQSHFEDLYESWIKGKPELEYHVYGLGNNAESVELACTGERSGGSYTWDQNDPSWTGAAMLLSDNDLAAYRGQHADAPIRVVAWEDDDEACVDHADVNTVTSLIAAVDAAYQLWTSGKVEPWLFRGIKAAPSIFNLIKSVRNIILTNDDLIGNAVETSIAGSAPGGANWLIKTDGTRTVGWFTTEYRR